jgi:hypothetical protein
VWRNRQFLKREMALAESTNLTAFGVANQR